MTEIAQPIDLNLSKKLRDRDYRTRFFWAEASARIAEQLIALRKRRGYSQKQVADMIGTKQPAISRAERADYQNWNLNTLRSIAEALDARVRVEVEPSEDVLHEYAGGAPEQRARPRQRLAQRLLSRIGGAWQIADPVAPAGTLISLPDIRSLASNIQIGTSQIPASHAHSLGTAHLSRAPTGGTPSWLTNISEFGNAFLGTVVASPNVIADQQLSEMQH